MQMLFPPSIYHAIESQFSLTEIREIRLRISCPVHVKTIRGDFFLRQIATAEIIDNIVQCATKSSRYAYEDEINDGYIPYKNGIRIGIIGTGKQSAGQKTAYKTINALCVRIPHEVFGCADALKINLQNFDNTLIISPPGCGKTTLLREMSRILSEKNDVLIVDERFEICGDGLSLTRGRRADVIQGVPKSLCYKNIIRTMSPEIVVFDELFGESDISAVERIIQSGIKCLATFHAETDNNLPKSLINCFQNIITLNSIPQVGNIKSIVTSPRSEV